MTFYKALVFVPFLAACGGGSSLSQGEPVEVPPPTAAALAALHLDIDSRARAEDPLVTDAMPTAGTATYRGAVEYYDENDAPEVYSAATLTANFADSSMSGVLDNFVFLADETRIDGRVTLVNGAIEGSDFSSDLAGALTLEGETVALSGDILGAFYRVDASLIGAEVFLTDGDVGFYGFLAAEK